MNVPRRSLTILPVLAALAFVGRTATAQGRDASAADALFQTAREAAARGDEVTACLRFAESYRLDPAPGTLLNVAHCEERQGKLATSYADLNQVLEHLPGGDFRVPYVRAQLASLKARVPTFTLILTAASGARVLRNDVELREASFGVPLPVDPGRHVFVVKAAGHRDGLQEVTIREGQHLSLTLTAGRPMSDESGGPATHDGHEVSPSTPSLPATEGRGPRPLAVGAFALGGIGLVTGAVTAWMFASAASTYRSHCDASGCDEEGLSAASRGKTLNVVSPVAFGVGGVGLGLGTYLWLTSRRPTARQVGVSPHLGSQLSGLTVDGQF